MKYITAINGNEDQEFETREEARDHLLKRGYKPTGESSPDGSAEYWYDPDEFDPDADNLDEYLGDGAYATQIVEREDEE